MPRRISDGGRSRTKQSRYWCSHAVSPGCRWQPQPEFPGTGPCRQTTRQPDTLRLTHCPAPDGSTSSTFSIRRKGRSICKGELHLFHRGPAGTPSALSNGWKQTPSQRYSAEVIDIPDDLEPRDAMQRGPSTRTRETRRPWLGRDHGISREVYTTVYSVPRGVATRLGLFIPGRSVHVLKVSQREVLRHCTSVQAFRFLLSETREWKSKSDSLLNT